MKSTMKNMVLSLTLITAIMGAVLAAVHQLTEAPIAAAELKAKTEALQGVLPHFDNDPLSDGKTVVTEADGKGVTVYTASLSGEPAGYAVESWTNDGFSGEIRVMVGFDTSGEITGYKVLQHAETPGLGAKADEWFRDPTGHRSIIGTTEPLTVSKDGGQIDGITAATITSRAFLNAVNRARLAIQKLQQQ